jgi:hypothetical protein
MYINLGVEIAQSAFFILLELWEMESILGLRGTAAMYWPIVAVPGDCEDGEGGGMKCGWQGKPKYSGKTCPGAIWSTTNPTCQTRARTRAAAVGSHRLTASAMPRPRSWHSDWLRAERPSGRSSSPGRIKNFLFSTSLRTALGTTQHPIQWVPGLFPQ